ncbi:MAG: hypothetical protein AAGA65_29655 [Actinomycetota bacterium]
MDGDTRSRRRRARISRPPGTSYHTRRIGAPRALGIIGTPVSFTAAPALDPLAGVAGPWASVLAFIQLTLGGIIATVFGACIDTTVTAVSVGGIVCGVLAMISFRWSVAALR